MGVLSWRGPVSPNFQRPLSSETVQIRPPKVLQVQNVLEILYQCAKFGGARISPAAGAAKNVQFFLFACLSVCSSSFWISEIVRPISPWSRWSTETILTPLDRGRFVVVHPCSTFSDCCQLATPLNAEVQKTAKMGFFASTGRHNKPIETKFRR